MTKENQDLDLATAYLLQLHSQLGPRGRAVLKAVAERLVKGGKEHGDFPQWPNAKPETLEEMLDAVVYLVVGLMPNADPTASG